MTLSVIIARFVKMPQTRKRSRAAANSPAQADIDDDANGRFLTQLLFYGLVRTILGNRKKETSFSRISFHLCPGLNAVTNFTY